MASDKDRIDYTPGDACKEAIAEGQEMWPDLGRLAVIDRLILIGLSAVKHVHWKEPLLPGRDRRRWRKPGG
jgi:hypothetical protein